MKSILLESIENESSDDINLFDVFENLMNDAMDKTRKEDLKKFFKLLKEEHPFFSLKLKYRGDVLTEAVLDGKRLKTENQG